MESLHVHIACKIAKHFIYSLQVKFHFLTVIVNSYPLIIHVESKEINLEGVYKRKIVALFVCPMRKFEEDLSNF